MYRIDREFLIAELGISSGRLAFSQSQFDDGKDDYARRTFIWSSNQFQISLDSDFIVSSDDNFRAEGRIVKDLSIIPDNGDGVRDNRTGIGNRDNFDFEGGGIATALNVFVEPSIDPSSIGRKVQLEFDSGSAPVYDYDFARWRDDVDNAPRSVGGFLFTSGTTNGTLLTTAVLLADGAAATARLGVSGPPFIQDLYSRGIIDYRQDGRDIFYGSLDDDAIQISLARDFQLYQAIAEGVATGGIAVGGPGADSFTGSILDDRFIIDRDDTFVNGGFGFDTVEYSTSNANNQNQESINFIVREDDQILIPGVPVLGDITGKKILSVAAAIGDNTTVFVGIERLAGTERADTLTVNSLAPIDNTDLVIDLKGNSLQPGGPDGSRTTDTLNLEGYSTSSVVISDLRNELQTVTDSEGGKGLRFKGVEAVRGSSGEDRIFASNSGDDIRGGFGEDEVTGGSRGDRIVGALETGVGSQFDDLAIDLLTGGGGADQFYAGDGDVITDPESGDEIYLRGQLLTGGEETEEGSRVYEDGKGGTYALASNGSLTFSINPTLNIQNFVNGRAGIRLIDKEPDTDDAEEQRDPLIIDLDGDRNVVAALDSSTAYFDLDNDGFAERVAWANASDGFLVRDLNGNGSIDNGTELFGTGRVDLDEGREQRFGEEGFIELALLDSNGDGVISAADVEFETLRVWVDANSDARTDEGELRTLTELGIVSINLITRPSDHFRFTDDSSIVLRSSSVAFDDGSSQRIYDVYLSIDQYDARENVDPDLDFSRVADLPNILGTGTVSDLHVAMARDPGLEELVRELADLDVAQAGEIHERVQAIILRWTGADAVDPESRGSTINGKWLHVIEQITGKPFSQALIGPNPRWDAASLLIEEWSKFVDRTTAKLVGSTALGEQLLPGTAFFAGAFFEVEDGTTIDQVLTSAASAAPASPSDKLGYWKAVTGTLRQYRTAFGLSEPAFEAAIDGVLASDGVPLTAEELRNAIIAGDASGLGVGSAKSTINGITYPGDRVLIADGENVVLSPSARDDRMIVTGAVQSLTFAGYDSGSDRIELLDWSPESLSVTSEVLSTDASVEEGRLSATLSVVLESEGRTIEFVAGFSNGEFRSPIDAIQFSDGSASELLDLVEDTAALVFGNRGAEFEFAAEAGDQFLFGRAGSDTYSVTSDSGVDLIVEEKDTRSSSDTLLIDATIDQADISVTGPLGRNLTINIAGGGSITIGGQFGDIASSIETFQFSDGLVLSAEEIKQRITTGTAQGEELVGTNLDDVIDGAGGGDVLNGRGGDDRYVVREGYGESVIQDNRGLSTIVFDYVVTKDDLDFTFDSGRLLIIDAANGTSVSIDRNQIKATLVELGGEAIDLGSILLQDALLAGTTTGNTIYGTAASDSINGTDEADLIIGNGGNDFLSGGGGNDTYRVTAGNISISDQDFGFDTIEVDSQFTLEDLAIVENNNSRRMRLRIGDNLYISLQNDADFQTGAAIVGARDVEQIVFADGRSLDLATGQTVNGTDGDDILFSYAEGAQTFTPGAGNDRIYSLNGRHEVVLTAGFGHDEYYDEWINNNDFEFSGMEFNGGVQFSREGFDLVISVTPDDSLTLKDVFRPLAPDFRNSFLRFSNTSLNLSSVVGQIAQATDGDDLLFGRTDLDGGAGNDILIGTGALNNYTFGRGSGHDVIKEQDGQFGDATAIDTLTLEGLNREDVSFSRSPADPLSIVITINDTGETLTLDGTPFDDAFADLANAPEDVFVPFDRAGAHWIERIIFADGSEIAQREVEQLILDSERTDGADTLYNFGSPTSFTLPNGAVLDGGTGDDTYINPYREIFVRMSAGQGSDRVLNNLDSRVTVHVQLDGIALSDLAAFKETRDGKDVTVLKATTGEELVIDGHVDFYDSNALRLIVTDEAGTISIVSLEGALTEDNASSDESDFQNGRLDIQGGEIIEPPTVFDDDFAPGAGDDVVFGRGGRDTVLMEVGDGRDTLIVDPGLSSDFGPGSPSDPGSSDSSYIVRLGEGFDVADFSFTWLSDGSDRVSLSFNAFGDGVIVDAGVIESVIYSDGTTLEFFTDAASDVIILPPSTTSVLNGFTDDTFIASNGGVRLRLRDDSGNDVFIDDFLSDGVAETDPQERGWTSNRIDLWDGTSLGDFEFVQDTSSPTDLIVRNIVTGSSIRIVGQIQEPPQGEDLWTDVGLGPDGAPDWSGFDLAFYDTDSDGTVNWNDPDVDGDGTADWNSFTDVTLDIDGDGEIDVFAYDDNSDGIYDSFDLVLDGPPRGPDGDPIIPIGPGPGTPIGPGFSTIASFYDTDGDNIVDAYFDPDNGTVALPTNPDGSVDWAAVDINQDGESDIASVDLDGDGNPDWDNPDLDGDGTADWQVETYDEFFNDGDFVTRRVDTGTGLFVYQIDAGFDTLLARDTDGDDTPDQFAYDTNFDGEPDPPEIPVVVDSFRLLVPTGPGTLTATTFEWDEIQELIIQRDESNPNAPIIVNLDEGRPVATEGDDILKVRVGDSVDGLGGNDLLLLPGAGATVVFGAASGNDVVIGDVDDNGGSTNTLELAGITSLSEIDVFETPNGRDMVIRIASTGESIRIEDQIEFDGFVPTIDKFRLADGTMFSWQIILGLVSGVAAGGETTISTGPDGGVLDGGSGNDQLLGGTGDDIYDFGRGYDEDTIRDAGGFDTVRFGNDITLDNLFFSRSGINGEDLLVEVTGRERLAFTIRGQFGVTDSRVESFELADGSTFDWFDVQNSVLVQVRTAGDDVIRGFASADVINGGSGNDELRGDGGNDLVDGGWGRDTAVFRGSQDEYEITFDGDRVTLTDLITDRDGTDTLVSVEEISFLGDGSRVLLIPENTAPTAGDLAFGTDEDTTLIIDRAALLAAASDGDADTIELGDLTEASNGSAWIGSDGNIRFRPDADFAGEAGFTFAVEDGNGGTGTARVSVSVASVNDAPLFAIETTEFVSLEDEPLDWRLPTNFAKDVDGDTLAITAQLQSGDQLPSWLVFDGAGFTGTPPANFNGTLDIELVADDGTATDSIALTIDILAVNDAPEVVTAIDDLSVRPGESFAFTVPETTFIDADGDPLNFAIIAGDGAALPDWITVNGLEISGTAPADIEEPVEIAVIADDGRAANATAFSIVPSTNTAPEVVVPLGTVSSDEDTPVSYTIPDGAFADADGDALTLSATLADGSDLPAWLSFDGTALTGTPPADFNGSLAIRIFATDGLESASNTLNLTIDPVNDAPLVSEALLDQTVIGDTLVQFSVSSGSFTDVDGDTLSYTATLADGTALPSWLTFDATTLLFGGTAPNVDGTLNIRLSASDGELSGFDDFALTIEAQNAGGGSTEGFSFASLNSWYNPAWGGGYNVTFNYEVQPEAIAEGELKAWDIVASYSGPGTITGGWVNGFPGPATFEITPEGAVFSTDGQDYQPELAEGQTFQITVQVDGAPYTAGDFAFEIFDRDPAFNLADDQDTSLTIAPTNDWGSGLSQNVSFANTSDTTIDDWQIVLDVPDGIDFAITNVWNATATVLANGDILFEAVSSNEEIAPGGQASFGFNASYSGVGSLTFSQSDFSFTDSDARQFDVVVESLGTAGAGANWLYGTVDTDDLTGTNGVANRVFGAVGDDTLTGGTLGDWLAGGSGDDTLFGLDGDDTLWGGHGNDLLYGGLGFDTVQLLGVRDSYSVVTQGGAFGVRINDLSAIAHGDDGMDQLSSIEQLAFRGGETLNITSPIILDLAGDGIETVSAADSDALFDLDGDGLADDTSWIGTGDAFLYVDRDGNGTMSGVEEISFIDDVENAATDLDGLAAFDSNGDGVLNSDDERFAEFGVWRDADGDGAVDAGETASLSQVDIASIDLTGTALDGVVEFGEVAIANTGTYTLTNGTTREFADAALTYFSASENVPELTATHYDFDRKSKKYRLSVADGTVTVAPKRARRGMDPLAGQLGANTILTFSNRTYGMFAPVALDLDGDGIELIKRKKSSAMFDYNGDGASDDTGWLKGDDGFLVIDRNNDGLITEASELSLASEDDEARSGLQGLDRLDSNRDGQVDANDARFGELRVWQDRNGNGRTDAGELRTLEEAGIVSIRLDAVTANQNRVKLGKNALVATTSFVRSNGMTGTAADVSLAYRPATAPATSAAFDVGTGSFGFPPDVFLPRGDFGTALRDEISLEDVFDRLRDRNVDAATDLFDRFGMNENQRSDRILRTLTVPVVEEAAPERPRSWFDPASAYFTMFWPPEIAPVFDQAFADSSLDLRLNAAFEGMSDTSSETEEPKGQHMRVMPDERVLLGEVVEAPVEAEAQSEEAGADSNGQSAPSNPPRLAIEDQEDWGGPLRVDFAQLTGSGATPEPLDILVAMRPEAANDTEQGGTSASVPASTDAELARKLMMIRQDMSTFGVQGAGAEERLHYENQDYLHFYA
ncbi:putative Ig domain-containing protein [Erythrobacter sp. MTPC3]|uniref:putative Ig domain-containing protein n=1 Tax=Erythrobacter sp. MTPC3 TaxID=3056564 RepID=UPI0036F23B19